MKRSLFFLYGIMCYFVFFVTFLYAVGFVGNILVPKTIDSGFQGGSTYAWLVDILLLSLFAVQHSVMARPGFKKWWTRIVPKPIERSTYVLLASVVLILLFAYWRPIDGTVWNVKGSLTGSILIAISFFGWFMVLLDTFLINHFHLFGLQQVYFNLKKMDQPHPKFVKPLFYKIVRHPLMFGFIIAFWATPEMSIGHLLFALATTGYILVAIQLEERDLVRFHGDEYRRYQQEVSQIIPMPPRRGGEVEAGAEKVY
jgi:protein-S-isoprenylcysteine O-methyltransferase Ste14